MTVIPVRTDIQKAKGLLLPSFNMDGAISNAIAAR
jgi:hypothetical protein